VRATAHESAWAYLRAHWNRINKAGIKYQLTPRITLAHGIPQRGGEEYYISIISMLAHS